MEERGGYIVDSHPLKYEPEFVFENEYQEQLYDAIIKLTQQKGFQTYEKAFLHFYDSGIEAVQFTHELNRLIEIGKIKMVETKDGTWYAIPV